MNADGMRPVIDVKDTAVSASAVSARSAKAVLQKNFLFRGLPDSALERIAALATRRSYPKGDGLPRTAGACALEDTSLIVIKRTDFLKLLEREPRLAIQLLKLLCERLRWTSALVEETAFLASPARLAKRLLILASLHGRSTSVGELELRISQSDLARFLNISRQIVNQNLSRWRNNGWVSLGNSRIVIRNPEALRRVVETG